MVFTAVTNIHITGFQPVTCKERLGELGFFDLMERRQRCELRAIYND